MRLKKIIFIKINKLFIFSKINSLLLTDFFKKIFKFILIKERSLNLYLMNFYYLFLSLKCIFFLNI